MNIKEQLEKFNQAPKIGEFDGCDNERDSHNKINQVPEKEETPCAAGMGVSEVRPGVFTLHKYVRSMF